MRKKHRVLFPFVGDSIGGSHISALTLVEELRRTDSFEPVIVLHTEGPLSGYLKDRGFQWKLIPLDIGWKGTVGKITTITKSAYALSQAIKQMGIDIVHTNDIRMHYIWAAATKLAKQKHVWHQRTLHSNPLTSLASRASDKSLAISQACLSRFNQQATIVPDPVTVPGEIPAKGCCRTSIIEAENLPPHARIVCWVANWSEQKRPFFLIDVARRIEGGPVVFLMIGEPRSDLRQEAEARIARWGLKDTVRILGARWPVYEWIAGSDLLIAAAMNEAFGRTLVEAMLVETPVLASAHAGHLEVVEHGKTGWTADPEDPEEFAKATGWILDNKKATSAIVKSARQAAEQRYSAKAHLEAVKTQYERLTGPEDYKTGGRQRKLTQR